MQRTYTSSDRTVGSFGPGWSSALGTALTADPAGGDPARRGRPAGCVAVAAGGGYTSTKVQSTLTVLPGGGWKITTRARLMTTCNAAG